MSTTMNCLTLFLTFAGAIASPYKDIPLEVIPIVDPPPINTPEPLLLPMVPNCEQFHLINPGETCDGISSSLGMSVQDLKSLNPFFSSGGQTCAENLLAGYWMCVKTLEGDDGGSGKKAPKAMATAEAKPLLPPIKGVDKWLTHTRNTKPAPKTRLPPVTMTAPSPPKKGAPTSTVAPVGDDSHVWGDIEDCKYDGECADWLKNLKTMY